MTCPFIGEYREQYSYTVSYNLDVCCWQYISFQTVAVAIVDNKIS